MKKMYQPLETPWGIVHIDPTPEAFDKLGLIKVRSKSSLVPLHGQNEYGPPISILGVGIEPDSRGDTVIWGKQGEKVVFFYPNQFPGLFKTT